MPIRQAENAKFLEIRLADFLGVKPGSLAGFLLKKPGENVKKGEPVAEKKGLKKRRFVSPINGVIESFTDEGILKIATKPEAVRTSKTQFPPHRKKEGELVVIEGFGGKGSGELVFYEEELTLFNLGEDIEEKVVAFPGKLSFEIWYKTASLGVSGVICASLPEENFQAKFGEEAVIPLLVAGDDEIIWRLLKNHGGKRVELDGEGKLILLIESEEFEKGKGLNQINK